jgi:hypothetical protein
MGLKKSPARRSKAPPNRETVEVEMDWLERDTKEAPKSTPSKAPPARTSKAPPKRRTVEVEIDWLEPELQEALKKTRPAKLPPPIPGAATRVPPLPVHPSLAPKAFPKPIPREEEDETPTARTSTRPSRAPRNR